MHLETGKTGEQQAADFLISKGYAVLERNWKYEKYEIDIIARQGDLIVFVEVKTRSGTSFGWPEQSVSAAKQEFIAVAAEEYLLHHRLDNEIRFDIISVLKKTEGAPQIYHIIDAFAP